MSKKLQIRNSTAEFLVFTKQAGEDTIDVRLEDETVWLTQKLIAVLFDVDIRTISEHLQNIFNSHELEANSVIRKFRITAVDGKNYNTQFYNLDLAEERAKRKIPLTMEDWAKRLELFLEFDGREILQSTGTISAEIAKVHAETEFEKYRVIQDQLYESDFDKEMKKLMNKY